MKKKILAIIIIFIAAGFQHVLPQSYPNISLVLLLPYLFIAPPLAGYLVSFTTGIILDGINANVFWISPLLLVMSTFLILFLRARLNTKLLITKGIVITFLLILYFSIKALVFNVPVFALSLRFITTTILSVLICLIY